MSELYSYPSTLPSASQIFNDFFDSWKILINMKFWLQGLKAD